MLLKPIWDRRGGLPDEPPAAKSSKLKLVDGLIQALPRPARAVQGRRDGAKGWCLTLITIIASLALNPHTHAQEVTRTAPPNRLPATEAASQAQGALPDLSSIPHATVIASGKPVPHVVIESDLQSNHGDLYLLSGNVEITYGDHVFHADSVSYNQDTGDLTAEGNLRLSGGDNSEYLLASHGTYNLNTETGRFYDVSGSVGLHNTVTTGYTNANPVLFAGRMVVKTGPRDYEVYDGSVTSCMLPKPDWQLFSRRFSVSDRVATARNSTFRLVGVPVLFLPYVTYPVDAQRRQSGFRIPVISQSSTKGFVIGESFYLVVGRSADLTMGTEYFSARGYSESGTFRYRGVGDDFFNGHFSALQDRGYIDAATKLYVNQGGQDVTAAFRRNLTRNIRAVGDVEYLSSYVYREAFTENFNQAVSSDITSIGYLVRQNNGYSMDARVDRYQGLKRVPIGNLPGQQVRIFHAPALDFDAVDHRIPHTPLLWNLSASAAGLKRSQPNFTSSGIIERLDFRPELALPLSGGGWHTLTSIGLHETLYSRSRRQTGVVPVELKDSLNRAAVDFKVDVRPPAIERTFAVPARFQKFFGTEVKHTVEPEATYRLVQGVDNFLSVLRFDDTDLLSNTNELEYGVTQHLYFRQTPKPVKPRPGCPAIVPGGDAAKTSEAQVTTEIDADLFSETPDSAAASSTDANGIPDAGAAAAEAPNRHARHADPCAPDPASSQQKEWFSWRLAQRHYFDPGFGGAVVRTRRNLFDSTLSLSGIAFLTEQRNISPLISRMRFRTGSHTDVEWDFDLDTGASKFTSSNIFLNAHEGPVFGALSFAQLNAPGRFYTESIDNNGVNTLVGSPTSTFSQMRVLLGYGDPYKPGLSMAANAGFDLNFGNVQYTSLQASYNWNCCGFSVEYRKYELGSVRNEGVERFNFTLVNIGSAGNLRKAERLF